MSRARHSWLPATIGLLATLVLAAGCYRPLPTLVMPTTGSEEPQAAEESPPDVIATARDEATRAAATATAQATEPPAEGEPTSVPTEATAEPAADEPTQEPEPTATTSEAQPTATSPQAQPTLVPTSVPAAATPSGAGIHVVQAGENLYRISLRYGVTQEALAAANGISNPNQIYAGQKLVIPTGGTGEQPQQVPAGSTTYVVRAGDNLYRIALRFGLSYQRLADYNGITDPNQIYVGQVLQIPPQ